MSNSSSTLIGKACNSRFQYFNVRTGRMEFKLRPVLIIGAERSILPCDLTVLPISKVSNPINLDSNYDYPLESEEHKSLNLKYYPSYIRTHKVSTINSRDLNFDTLNASIKDDFPENYATIKSKFEEFSRNLF